MRGLVCLFLCLFVWSFRYNSTCLSDLRSHSCIGACVSDLYVCFAQDKESVYDLLKAIDKSNGYVFGALKPDNFSIMQVATQESATAYSRYGAGLSYSLRRVTGFDP